MISTDFATKHILLKVGNEVAMIAVSAEKSYRVLSSMGRQKVFYVLA